ncbi:MAG: hypothetical protein HEQ23_00795 [Tepidisphaera sp.]
MRLMKPSAVLWFGLYSALGAASAAHGQCARWMPAPSLCVEGRAAAMLVHDLDGAGPLPPQLIVGGLFERAGGAGAEGILARNVAAWNGTNWTTLGSGFNDIRGLDYGGVQSLVTYGGALYLRDRAVIAEGERRSL